MDNAASHAYLDSGATEGTLGSFKAFKLSNVTVLFLPPNTTSVIQPLDAGIIAAFKTQYKKKLVAWQVAEMAARLEANHGNPVDLGKVLCDVKQAIMWSCEAWEEMDPQTIRNCWRKVNILPQLWNQELVNADERVRGRMDAAAAELSALIAALNLGDLALEVEEFVDCEPPGIEEQLTDAELVAVVLAEDGIGAVEEMELEDYDSSDDEVEDPNSAAPPLVKLQEARVYAALLLQFVQDQPYYPSDLQMCINRVQGELSRTAVANLNRLSQTTIDQFFAPAAPTTSTFGSDSDLES
jgi:hypothetical protein